MSRCSLVRSNERGARPCAADLPAAQEPATVDGVRPSLSCVVIRAISHGETAVDGGRRSRQASYLLPRLADGWRGRPGLRHLIVAPWAPLALVKTEVSKELGVVVSIGGPLDVSVRPEQECSPPQSIGASYVNGHETFAVDGRFRRVLQRTADGDDSVLSAGHRLEHGEEVGSRCRSQSLPDQRVIAWISRILHGQAGVNRPDFRSVLQARMEHDESEVLAGDA